MHHPHGLPIEALTVSRLRQIIKSSGLSDADCLEIADLRSRAHHATEILLRQRAAQPLHKPPEPTGTDELVCTDGPDGASQ